MSADEMNSVNSSAQAEGATSRESGGSAISTL
jgi:hypothetical protein